MGRTKNCGRCNKPKRPKGKQFKDAEGYCKCGRPPIIDKNVLQKLEDAFSNACTDDEACIYANIGATTLYDYQKANPEFVERKRMLRLTPNLQARRTIVNALNNTSEARWWLEKKDAEFKPTTKMEHVVEKLPSPIDELSDKEKELLKQMREARIERIKEKSRKMEKPI